MMRVSRRVHGGLLGLLSTAAFLFAASGRAQESAQAVVRPRIAATIDESSLTTLRKNTHPLARAEFDRGEAPVSMPAPRILLVLTRSMQQEADLETFLQSVQDPSSANYHKYLTPEEFGKRFGVDDTDLATVETWLTGHGFAVNRVTAARTAIEFSGTVGQVEAAFHTSIHSYAVSGKLYWANSRDPEIPSALAAVVAGPAALNNFKPQAQYIRGPSGVYDAQEHAVRPAYTTGSASSGYMIYLGPADAATIYDTPTSLNPNQTGTLYDGTGATIGIAGDSNINITQNNNYRATFGLSANPTTVVVDGNDPGENGDAIEAYLDTQVAGGIAPNARVILYTAANTSFDYGLYLAIQRAIDDNEADILNVSFGACETSMGTAGNQYLNSLWEQAAAQGITVTVSSGDSGSAECDDPNTETMATQGLAVNAFASTPYNVSVGGTDYDVLHSQFTTYVNTTNTLANHRSALMYIPEEPWNDSTYPNTSIANNKPLSATTGQSSDNNIIGGSGGVSNTYPLPKWQANFATGAMGRAQPDVSFLAGNGMYGAIWGICTDLDTNSSGNSVTDCAAGATGNNFYLTGVGGTSAAAPAFAGMLALVKQKVGARLGQVDPVLYGLAATKYSTVFHDITAGDNSMYCKFGTSGCASNSLHYNFMTGYNATTGYDMASGLGSVDVTQLANNWTSVPQVTTTTALTLNGSTAPLSITHGASVAVSANVTGAAGTPSGVVALVDNLNPATQPNSEGGIGFTLSGGTAAGTTTSLPGGTYQLTAHYSGDSTYAQSDSNAIAVTVGMENSTTSLKIGSYNPTTGQQSSTPYYGLLYTLDAQPYGSSSSASNPDGVATGTVTFKNGTATLGSAQISSDGIAELQTTMIPGGLNNLTAVFPGDNSFLQSTSSPVALTVVPAVTTLSAALQGQISAANSATVTATLTTSSAGVAPTGTVSIMNGATSVGSAALSGSSASGTTMASGSATVSTSALPEGTYNLTVTYSGDSNYAGSTSSGVPVTIPYRTSLVTAAPSPATIKENEAVQITATVSGVTGLPTPTGTVTVLYGSTSMPAANLVNGTVAVTIPANSLPAGMVVVTTNYSGDTYYSANSGSTTVTVDASGTLTPAVIVTPPTGKTTYPYQVAVAVTGPTGDPSPTGTVTLTGTSYQASQQLLGGSASFTISGGPTGFQNTLTASYTGDTNYAPASGSGTVTIFAQPVLSFSSLASSVPVNEPLPVTVTVGGNPNVGMATGTVTLSSGSYRSAVVQLVGGSASFTIPANTLPMGQDAITAAYSGDTNYAPGSLSQYLTVTTAVQAGISLNGTAVSVIPGATTGNTSTITVTPAGGFTGDVALTAAVTSSPSGAQYTPTLSFGTTSPVSITSATAQTATLTIATTGVTALARYEPGRLDERWYGAGGAALACLWLIAIPARRRRWRTLLGLATLLALTSLGVSSCGGGSIHSIPVASGTTAGSYQITVTGTSGSVTATTVVNLTVQ